MLNVINREGLDNPFQGAFAKQKRMEYSCNKNVTPYFSKNIDDVLDSLGLRDGMAISFHHHLRNGDFVLSMVMERIRARKLKNLTLFASSIFPTHSILVDCLKDKTVTQIFTSYMSGPVARAVSQGLCEKPVMMTTHGGRPRMILEKEVTIDVAFIASPAVDKTGAISGSEGPSSCGSLGYAVADAWCANKVVAITDFLCDKVQSPDIQAGCTDFVVEVDKIGDPKGIVSGTTQITKDPVGLKIARDVKTLIEFSGLFKPGFSMQTGAGGISLAVSNEVKSLMLKQGIKGSFACGGITGYFVSMLEAGLFSDLYDVQCFDLASVASIQKNKQHHKISADLYANPNNPNHIAGKLDTVILGASEIDTDFNVNVTTGSDGIILGGSGGHADTAAGAKLTVVVSKLFNARISCLVEKVRTVTTPGETVDAFVTERGIAINPKHTDLIEKIKKETKLKVYTMPELLELSRKFTGKPKVLPRSGKVIGMSVYRDGTILDTIDQVEV